MEELDKIAKADPGRTHYAHGKIIFFEGDDGAVHGLVLEQKQPRQGDRQKYIHLPVVPYAQGEFAPGLRLDRVSALLPVRHKTTSSNDSGAGFCQDRIPLCRYIMFVSINPCFA
jgi:hypothetical protein